MSYSSYIVQKSDAVRRLQCSYRNLISPSTVIIKMLNRSCRKLLFPLWHIVEKRDFVLLASPSLTDVFITLVCTKKVDFFFLRSVGGILGFLLSHQCTSQFLGCARPCDWN